MTRIMAICPACGDHMVFRLRPGSGRPELYARCAACEASYTLWGGSMRAAPDDGPAPVAREASRST
jgi:hypothetical protein